MKQICLKTFVIFLLLINILTLPIIYADDVDTDFSTISSNEIISTSSDSLDTSLNLNSRSCIVLDRTSKQILYGKNETNQVKMASTTKIMTCIVIIENFDLNTTVEASKKAAGTGGSRLGLKTGDKITIRDLLYGLMLCSGNDAAVCLAESTCGSVANFADMMNNKAEELGLNNTHFESPHGLDSDEHYTTAYELAILTDYALNNEIFSQIVGTKTTTITINGYPKNLSNTNELLGNLNGIYGVKTGFTNGANRCLVTACKRDNMDIICVVLGCDTKKFRTQDSIKLIEWAFKNYEYVNIENILNGELTEWKQEYSNSISIKKGKNALVNFSYLTLEHPIIPIKKSLIDNIEIHIFVDNNLNAPVFENDKVGYATVFAQDNFILDCDIVANESIEKKDMIFYINDFFRRYKMICVNVLNELI